MLVHWSDGFPDFTMRKMIAASQQHARAASGVVAPRHAVAFTPIPPAQFSPAYAKLQYFVEDTTAYFFIISTCIEFI